MWESFISVKLCYTFEQTEADNFSQIFLSVYQPKNQLTFHMIFYSNIFHFPVFGRNTLRSYWFITTLCACWPDLSVFGHFSALIYRCWAETGLFGWKQQIAKWPDGHRHKEWESLPYDLVPFGFFQFQTPHSISFLPSAPSFPRLSSSIFLGSSLNLNRIALLPYLCRAVKTYARPCTDDLFRHSKLNICQTKWTLLENTICCSLFCTFCLDSSAQMHLLQSQSLFG